MASVQSNLDDKVAHMPEVGAALQRVADAVAVDARAEFARHVASGGFLASITIEHGAVDRLVVAEAEDSKGRPVAIPIEFGHFTNPGKDGSMVWVPGLWMLRAAALKHRGSDA